MSPWTRPPDFCKNDSAAEPSSAGPATDGDAICLSVCFLLVVEVVVTIGHGLEEEPGFDNGEVYPCEDILDQTKNERGVGSIL